MTPEKKAKTLSFLSLVLIITAVIVLPFSVICAADDNLVVAFLLGILCMFMTYAACALVLVAGKIRKSRAVKVITVIDIIFAVICMVILIVCGFILGMMSCFDGIGDFFHHC